MYRYYLFGLTVLLFISCGKPKASFVANYVDEVKSKTNIAFKNNSKNAGKSTWYFGDGTTSSETDPQHDYSSFGTLMVILEVSKGEDIDRDTQYLTIVEPPRTKVKIETDFGNMIAELYNSTPFHRDNFIRLANDKFYDGLLFHRIMDGFMVQGGDPDSRDAPPGQVLGMGGPGYLLKPEIGELHYTGTLAAARMPDNVNPNRESSGSQFYIVEGRRWSTIELANIGSQIGITYTPEQKQIYTQRGGYPPLDKQYTVFGQVIEGLNIIDSLSRVEVDGADRPLKDYKMKVSVVNE